MIFYSQWDTLIVRKNRGKRERESEQEIKIMKKALNLSAIVFSLSSAVNGNESSTNCKKIVLQFLSIVIHKK